MMDWTMVALQALLVGATVLNIWSAARHYREAKIPKTAEDLTPQNCFAAWTLEETGADTAALPQKEVCCLWRRWCCEVIDAPEVMRIANAAAMWDMIVQQACGPENAAPGE